MELTNRLGLPTPILKAIKNDTYSRGGARISVTELISSPRIRVLRNLHRNEIVEDASDRFWAVIGTALHHVMEENSDQDHISEQRLFATVQGWEISGGIDLQIPSETSDGPGMSIADYKMTTAWSVMQDKIDWERQLNCYAYLIEINKKLPVTTISIIAVIRDWSRRLAAVQTDYPQSPMLVLEQKLWPMEERERYIKERIKLHQASDRAADWHEDLIQCSEEERWTKAPKWAVQKAGAKRALRVFNSNAEADNFAEDKNLDIVFRPGEDTRCLTFCAVSEWCDQFQESKKERVMTDD